MAKNETRLQSRIAKKPTQKSEWDQIAEYFDFFEEHSSSEELWKMLKLALTSKSGMDEIRERSNLIFFYEFTKDLLHSVSILLEARKHGGKLV